MSAPLQLISFGENGKLFVGEEAAATLSSIKGPVGVVAVCGRARTGKSFLLNQLLGQSAGFKVAASQRPCTKGVWMWSAPIPRRMPGGKEYHLVLLDTEGIDAYDQTNEDGVRIFSLALLLSSLFVYNQMGGIDEAALDRLSLVTELSKHIRVKAGSVAGMESMHDLAEYSPNFLWLLRDFFFDLEDDDGKITPSEYLEMALQPVPGHSAAVAAKNQIRTSIKTIFPERCCHTLVRPMHEERDLRRLSELPLDTLRPQFQQELSRLTAYIFSTTYPKRIGGQVITGPILAGLAAAYVKAMNNGAVPTIATAWQAVADAESRRAADAAEMKYQSVFRTDVRPEEGPLLREHLRAMAIAKNVFKEIAVGDKRLRKAHKERFVQLCEDRFRTLCDAKFSQAAENVNTLLMKAAQQLDVMTRTAKNFDDYDSQLQQIVSAYNAQAEGPTKHERLVSWLLDQYGGGAKDFIWKLDMETKEKLHLAHEDRDEAHRRVKNLEGQIESLKVAAAQAQRPVQAYTVPPPSPRHQWLKKMVQCGNNFN